MIDGGGGGARGSDLHATGSAVPVVSPSGGVATSRGEMVAAASGDGDGDTTEVGGTHHGEGASVDGGAGEGTGASHYGSSGDNDGLGASFADVNRSDFFDDDDDLGMSDDDGVLGLLS